MRKLWIGNKKFKRISAMFFGNILNLVPKGDHPITQLVGLISQRLEFLEEEGSPCRFLCQSQWDFQPLNPSQKSLKVEGQKGVSLPGLKTASMLKSGSFQ